MKDIVVFFDLFDTLIHVDRGYLEQYFDYEIDKLGDMGILKDAKTTIDKIVKKNPELLIKYTIDEMVHYYEDCMSRSLIDVNKDILLMLEELKENGFDLCVISDASYVDIKDWKKSPLSKYFNKTIFSCEV